jgi:hypothetical protein
VPDSTETQAAHVEFLFGLALLHLQPLPIVPPADDAGMEDALAKLAEAMREMYGDRQG